MTSSDPYNQYHFDTLLQSQLGLQVNKDSLKLRQYTKDMLKLQITRLTRYFAFLAYHVIPGHQSCIQRRCHQHNSINYKEGRTMTISDPNHMIISHA